MSKQTPLYSFTLCLCLMLSFQCLPVDSFTINKSQSKRLNLATTNKHNFQSVKQWPFSKTHTSQFRLHVGFFWEDDLPNLFGINPIEASVIFGILYYLYGPDELYGYAREAGKLFSTYVPVVRDLAVNIYNEFKEYIDEDKERDEMMKRGIDVSKFPRRTTNLIERVQESIDMLSEMTKVASSNGRDNTFGDDIQIGLTPELFKDADKLESEDSSGTKLKKRKTKKKILEGKNIDVSKLIEFENASQKPDGQVEAELSKSINLVQERFAAMSGGNSNNNQMQQPIDASQFGSMLPPPSASMMGRMISDDNINDDDDYFFPGARAPPVTPSFSQQSQSPPPSTEGMSRFQQQMSGMWNQKVLEREGVSGAVPTTSDWGSTDWEDPLALTASSTTSADPSDQSSQVTESVLYNDFGMPMDLDSVQTPQPVQVSPVTSASSDSNDNTPFYPYAATTAETIPLYSISNDVNDSDAITSVVANEEVSAVLAELDRDYQALRRKLVNAIMTVERKTSLSQTSQSLTSIATLNSTLYSNSNISSTISPHISSHHTDSTSSSSSSSEETTATETTSKSESLLTSHSPIPLPIDQLTTLTSATATTEAEDASEDIMIKRVYWPPGVRSTYHV